MVLGSYIYIFGMVFVPKNTGLLESRGVAVSIKYRVIKHYAFAY